MSITLHFAAGVLLARLLGPEPFGLVAIALLVLGLGNLLASGGLGAALIQRKELRENDIRAVFFLQLAVGGGLALLLAVGSPYVAGFFQKPQAAPVVAAMALLFVIQPLGQTSAFLLRRELRFKHLQIAQIASYCLGYLGLGVPLALNGAGVWALVAAQLTQAAIYASVVYLQTRHSFFPVAWPRGRGLFGFGAIVTASNVSNYGFSNLDSILVGRLFGAAELGLYNRAFVLASLPMTAVTSSLQPVLFSACARAQERHQSVRRAFLAAVGAVGLLLLPVCTSVAAVADVVVLGLYGDGWERAIPLLVPLALAMPVNGILAMVGPVLTGLGKPEVELRAQLMALALAGVLLPLAASHGFTALPWAVLAAYLVRMGLFLGAAMRILEVKPCQLLGVLAVPAAMALLLGAFAWLLRWGLLALQTGVVGILVVEAIACGTLYLALLRWLRRWILRGPIKEIMMGAVDLPQPLMRWMGLSQ